MDARLKVCWGALLAVWCATGLLGGCAQDAAGGQTGDEDALPRIRIPGPGVANDACTPYEPPEVVSLDDDSAGFTPQAVLELATGSFRPALSWHPDGRWEWEAERQITPSPGEDETLELEIVHGEGDGDVRYIGSAQPSCSGHYEIDVQLSLRTESGALDEQLDGVLRAWDGEAWLELRFHSRAFEIDTPTAIDGPPPAPILPLMGALAIEQTLMYPPEGSDPDDDAAYTLADAGVMAAIELSLSFEGTGGPYGDINAWMYGPESGVLRRTDGIATIGEHPTASGASSR